MDETIKKYIEDLESDRNIKVLWAVETGSRAWGFPSTDSDYDIRLLYVHRAEWYLNLTEKKDSIELMLDDNLIDISGWDLRKSLNLLRKSNASLLERIQSPIVYMSDADFQADILRLGQHCYSRIATIHHYLSMSQRFFKELHLDEDYKLKKFFYTLRSALVCKWILENEEMPPIEFVKIYQSLDLSDKVINQIENLIQVKATVGESYRHQGEHDLLSLVLQSIEDTEKFKDSLPGSKIDLDLMNGVFRKYIYKYDS